MNGVYNFVHKFREYSYFWPIYKNIRIYSKPKSISHECKITTGVKKFSIICFLFPSKGFRKTAVTRY